jgi:hypothetical protein
LARRQRAAGLCVLWLRSRQLRFSCTFCKVTRTLCELRFTQCALVYSKRRFSLRKQL